MDGLPFHDFMMSDYARREAVYGAEAGDSYAQAVHNCFNLSKLHIQCYRDFSIASYTLLISAGIRDGLQVATHNEGRVIRHLYCV